MVSDSTCLLTHINGQSRIKPGLKADNGNAVVNGNGVIVVKLCLVVGFPLVSAYLVGCIFLSL